MWILTWNGLGGKCHTHNMSYPASRSIAFQQHGQKFQIIQDSSRVTFDFLSSGGFFPGKDRGLHHR